MQLGICRESFFDGATCRSGGYRILALNLQATVRELKDVYETFGENSNDWIARE